MSKTTVAIRSLITLTKPGIIIGNLMIAAASFLYASHDMVAISTLAFFLIGTATIIGASCIVNNYMDIDIDKHMARTAKRPSVTNVVAPYSAYLFAAILFLVGVTSLRIGVSEYTAQIGILGAILYVLVYTPLKRRTYLATVMGTLPGAIPVLAGFMAGQGYIGVEGWIVFGLMVCWQMPHFYAISVFRHTDYKVAKVPTISVVKGIGRTILEIRLYIALFITLVMALVVYDVLNIVSVTVLLALGLYWLKIALQPTTKSVQWAHSVFKTSLLVLPTLAVLLSIDSLIR